MGDTWGKTGIWRVQITFCPYINVCHWTETYCSDLLHFLFGVNTYDSQNKLSFHAANILTIIFSVLQLKWLDYFPIVGQDNVVSIVIRYRLEGLGIKTRWVQDFCTSLDQPWGPPSLLYNGYQVLPGHKQPGRGVYHPSPSSAEVKERAQIYLYSASGALWPVLGWTSPFTSTFTFPLTTANIQSYAWQVVANQPNIIMLLGSQDIKTHSIFTIYWYSTTYII